MTASLPRRAPGALLVATAATVALAACAGPGNETSMLLENLTDTPVAVHADGSWVGTYEAGAVRSVRVDGELPVGIEIVTPTGAVLVEWGIDPASPTGGAVSVSEVPCGVIRLSVGRVELPALDPAPATGACR